MTCAHGAGTNLSNLEGDDVMASPSDDSSSSSTAVSGSSSPRLDPRMSNCVLALRLFFSSADVDRGFFCSATDMSHLTLDDNSSVGSSSSHSEDRARRSTPSVSNPSKS
eukprot:539539-Rhodomonas_salina.1